MEHQSQGGHQVLRSTSVTPLESGPPSCWDLGCATCLPDRLLLRAMSPKFAGGAASVEYNNKVPRLRYEPQIHVTICLREAKLFHTVATCFRPPTITRKSAWEQDPKEVLLGRTYQMTSMRSLRCFSNPTTSVDVAGRQPISRIAHVLNMLEYPIMNTVQTG